MRSNSKHELVKLISICGQVAEHKSEKAQEHGKEEDAILAALTMEEQKQLQALLTKLQDQWRKDHAVHHEKNQHLAAETTEAYLTGKGLVRDCAHDAGDVGNDHEGNQSIQEAIL